MSQNADSEHRRVLEQCARAKEGEVVAEAGEVAPEGGQVRRVGGGEGVVEDLLLPRPQRRLVEQPPLQQLQQQRRRCGLRACGRRGRAGGVGERRGVEAFGGLVVEGGVERVEPRREGEEEQLEMERLMQQVGVAEAIHSALSRG